MKAFRLPQSSDPLKLLLLGAHSDDIEIGLGATVLGWIASRVRLDVTWCVLSARDQRGVEARGSAGDFLAGATSQEIALETFRDGYFPQQGIELKDWFEALKVRIEPDLIFTHRGDDAHQDHREVSRLTWNTDSG